MSTFDKITKIASDLLYSSDLASECRNYLSSRLNEEAQKIFNFGFFPPFEYLSLLSSYVSLEELQELSLLYLRDAATSEGIMHYNHGYFDLHPLIMPYRNCYGEIIGLVGRTFLSEEERKELGIAKYKNTQFVKGNHLFGLFEGKEEIIRKGFVYIVEGQFDAIKAYEQGIRNVVALGSANMTGVQFTLISRYTNDIRLLLDNDSAGTIGRERIIKKFGRCGKSVRNVFLPSGYKDLDEFLKDNDGSLLETLILLEE